MIDNKHLNSTISWTNGQTERQTDILVIFLLNALNLQQTRVLLVLVFAGCGGCSDVRMEKQVEHMVSDEGQGAALSLHLSTEGVVVLKKTV